MNKKILAVSLILIFVIAASIAYVLVNPEKTTPTEESPSQTTETTDQQPSTSEATMPGVYTNYSADALAATKGTKLLFFHAPWCPQCRELDASIKASTLPSDLTIFKVDYDTNQALRAKYGVTIQTTVVKVDDAGNRIASYVAYDKPVFESVRQALLP